MTAVFDSYAWIEYFAGTEKGGKVRAILQSSEPKYTPAVCVTEVKNKYLKAGLNPDANLRFMMEHTTLIDISGEIASQAADAMHDEKLHTIDAIIYAAAKKVKGTLITGDQHFKKLPNVSMLE